MGKKERGMLKKICVFILLAGVVFLSGCETARGVSYGVARTAEGIGKDSVSFWKLLWSADSWMKEHLW